MLFPIIFMRFNLFYLFIHRMGSQDDDGDSKRVRLDDLNLSTTGNVTEVGTTNPVEDFVSLLKQGYDLSTGRLSSQMSILKECYYFWTFMPRTHFNQTI